MLRLVHRFVRQRLFTSARFKLVAWYVSVLALVLVSFSSALIGIVQHNLNLSLNERLITNGRQLADLVELREGQLLFAKLDELNVENDALRSLSVQMFDPSGKPLWQAIRNQVPSSPTLAESLSTGEDRLTSLPLQYERYRVLTTPVHRDGRLIGVLQVGLSLRDIDDAIAKLVIALALTVPIAIFAAAIGGWFLAARALRPIEASLAQQRQFVQDASHELRTPLAIIQSNIDVALQNPEPTVEQLSDKLRTVRETSKRMGKVIEDLFTLTTSDSRALRLKPKLIDLDKIAKDVVRQMRSLARKKEQDLSIGELESLVIFADEDRMKQIATILIDNAIKYTPERGSIVVTVTKTPAIDFARLSVKDSGPGISKENQAKIFERFYRVDKSRARMLGGNGLGLPIARTLVEKQRGYINVQSKPGEGSRFDVYVPLVAKKSAAGFSMPTLPKWLKTGKKTENPTPVTKKATQTVENNPQAGH